MTIITRRAALAASAALALTLAVPALAQTTQVVRIGVSPGPHAEILEKVKPLLATKGIDLKIIEFSDYVVPNQALDAGELEANSFQNQPYLDNQVKDRGFKIQSVGLTVNFPARHLLREAQKLGRCARWLLGCDPERPDQWRPRAAAAAGQGRHQLKDGVGFKPSRDITANPKKLKIIEVEAAQTPRTLADVAAAAINTNYAVDAKIEPTSAILREDPKGLTST